jgi:hypothetical protein
MPALHRVLLATLLVGNTLVFAGVDPWTRFATAVIVVVLMVDLRRLPTLPEPALWAAAGLAALVVAQLVPLPEIVRRLVEPGYSEVMRSGWAPLSLAPWATVMTASSIFVAFAVALVAARMAGTRSGLPVLLALLAVTCGLIGVLGLGSESGAPEKVMLLRANTGGGGTYGPFVNSNHYATAVELTVPAALVLFMVAARNLARSGAARQRAAVVTLASAVAVVVAVGAVMRCGSRGGVLFLATGVVVTLPFWMRPWRARRWPWIAALAGLLAVAVALAWTRMPELRDGFAQLFVVEGVEGNSRWDLWAGTVRSFARSPIVGSGLGSYRYVIGLDKPATGVAVLEQAHNDWLEWLSTAGVAGAAVMTLLLFSLLARLRPRRVRHLRFELRYPLAGAAAALVATSLHEIVGFGVQTPLNRYLVAVWVGLVWGVWNRVEEGRARATMIAEGEHDGGGSSKVEQLDDGADLMVDAYDT